MIKVISVLVLLLHVALSWAAGRWMANRGRQGWAFTALILVVPPVGYPLWLLNWSAMTKAERHLG